MRAARSTQPAEDLCAAPTLRQLAMRAIAETRFVPEKGRNRIGSMVEGRPDWVISRQRAWGVPIALFVERKTGQLLVDHDVNQRIVAAIKAEGVDAWDEARAQDYLGNNYNAADYEMQADILDVWFDSGCTHVFTLESGHWPDQRWPADLYLEGSDQHRGWFQSSLLESCGTRGRAPFDAVLTHGFTMDSKGMKMSKSVGNTINPLDLMRDYGADILRLWALSVDFTEDHRIGKEILAGVADQYRKLRNTFRYLLGALEGFSEDERIGFDEMPELERYMLALTAELDARLRKAVDDYDFNDYTRALADFCNNDLSAFFFDIRKDSLYCDAPGDPKRRAYRTVLDTLFHALVRWAAPVLVFTSEEVWGTRYPDAGSVHLLEWPLIDPQWREDDALAGEMGCASRATRGGDRSDRAAAARKGDRLQPRGRSNGSERCRSRRFWLNCSSSRQSRQGDALTVTKTDQPQMRPLLAAPARGCRGRRPVRALRGCREWLTALSPMSWRSSCSSWTRSANGSCPARSRFRRAGRSSCCRSST